MNPHDVSAANLVCDLLVGLLLIGIARAWELVGDRDTGVISSIAVLTGRDTKPDVHTSEAAKITAWQDRRPHSGPRPGWFGRFEE
jgi:hypothetical protein